MRCKSVVKKRISYSYRASLRFSFLTVVQVFTEYQVQYVEGSSGT